ncbi:hypothetical protein B0T10DRAFT_473667 [Thelonectria olida]|uniref:Uncharacterized protein n=1 Tax=Thelonectria olida TaxID=1576542 RepID=A0A9P8WIW9_9HYPO|nr:hypothetical protein B0T10DRAFT_473667 [Thelonectria olida]
MTPLLFIWMPMSFPWPKWSIMAPLHSPRRPGFLTAPVLLVKMPSTKTAQQCPSAISERDSLPECTRRPLQLAHSTDRVVCTPRFSSRCLDGLTRAQNKESQRATRRQGFESYLFPSKFPPLSLPVPSPALLVRSRPPYSWNAVPTDR